MQKRIRQMYILGFLTSLAFLSLVKTTMAWFTTVLQFNTKMTGSSISNYYASGTGTEADPYIIRTPKHLYNFSWLQNSGAYPEKTYFELGNDIDMKGSLTGFLDIHSGATIPPIGTDEAPFLGSFDGNGYTLKNLWVSSDPLDWKENQATLKL